MNTRRFSDACLTTYTLAAIIVLQTSTTWANDSIKDSSQTSVIQKRSNMKLIARVHSMGLFGFAGLIANDNPSVDISGVYDRPRWGCFLLKAVDVYDLQSPYDFTLGLFYTTLKLGEKVTITPYAGFVLEQTHHFAGHGSDAMVVVNTTYKIDNHFSFEHTGRFSNVVVENDLFDWLNRFRIAYSGEHVDVMLTCWHNNNVFDNNRYTTVGFNAAYSRIRLSKQVTISTGITGLLMMNAPNFDAADKRNGLLLTIATTVD